MSCKETMGVDPSLLLWRSMPYGVGRAVFDIETVTVCGSGGKVVLQVHKCGGRDVDVVLPAESARHLASVLLAVADASQQSAPSEGTS